MLLLFQTNSQYKTCNCLHHPANAMKQFWDHIDCTQHHGCVKQLTCPLIFHMWNEQMPVPYHQCLHLHRYLHCYCWRHHTILNMKYCVYVCPVSLAELCIAEWQLNFICMYECLDDQIYDVFWRHRNFTVKITYSRSLFDFPNTLVEPDDHHHGPWKFVYLVLVANFYMSGCLSKYFSR
jgi:hypothetical protein